ncbi:uncharacterized protein LOC124256810 isoform X2 [Haliotis rubra]|uniref:uncharacterized protein LOC124256810 isoform X2 n=1 Tax=Haliotis rubra TaxID=36100 RepID=UPI001EE5C794|nr:uncharacterized protein LOC124256810 isoform X2 [Haliotis rubra]
MASRDQDNSSLMTGEVSSGHESTLTGGLAGNERETNVVGHKYTSGGNATADLKETGLREDKTTSKCICEERTEANASSGAEPSITEGSVTHAKPDPARPDRETTVTNGDPVAHTHAKPDWAPPDRETTVTKRDPAADIPGTDALQANHQPKFQRVLQDPLFFICAMSTATGLAGGILGTLGTLYFAPAFVNVRNSNDYTSSSTTLHQQVNTMTTTLDQCLKQNVADNEKIKWLEANITIMRDDMYSNYSNVELKSYILDGRMEELTNKFLSKEWIFLILLMGILEIAAMAAVWKMWTSFTDVLATMRERPGGGARRGLPNGEPRLNNDVIRGDENILNSVSPRHLENRVCVVSFHSDTINQHHTQVDAVLSQNDATRHITVTKHCVKGHELILRLPPCKVYFLFVDFNERHVILEDPTKGLGDLRLTTVQAIRKMGGDVVVIYSRDGGSRSLPPGTLYNSNLTSIRNHPELRRLDNDQRMLSVFEKFNQSQIDRIVKIVKEHRI